MGTFDATKCRQSRRSGVVSPSGLLGARLEVSSERIKCSARSARCSRPSEPAEGRDVSELMMYGVTDVVLLAGQSPRSGVMSPSPTSTSGDSGSGAVRARGAALCLRDRPPLQSTAGWCPTEPAERRRVSERPTWRSPWKFRRARGEAFVSPRGLGACRPSPVPAGRHRCSEWPRGARGAASLLRAHAPPRYALPEPAERRRCFETVTYKRSSRRGVVSPSRCSSRTARGGAWCLRRDAAASFRTPRRGRLSEVM